MHKLILVMAQLIQEAIPIFPMQGTAVGGPLLRYAGHERLQVFFGLVLSKTTTLGLHPTLASELAVSIMEALQPHLLRTVGQLRYTFVQGNRWEEIAHVIKEAILLVDKHLRRAVDTVIEAID